MPQIFRLLTLLIIVTKKKSNLFIEKYVGKSMKFVIV